MIRDQWWERQHLASLSEAGRDRVDNRVDDRVQPEPCWAAVWVNDEDPESSVWGFGRTAEEAAQSAVDLAVENGAPPLDTYQDVVTAWGDPVWKETDDGEEIEDYRESVDFGVRLTFGTEYSGPKVYRLDAPAFVDCVVPEFESVCACGGTGSIDYIVCNRAPSVCCGGCFTSSACPDCTCEDGRGRALEPGQADPDADTADWWV